LVGRDGGVVDKAHVGDRGARCFRLGVTGNAKLEVFSSNAATSCMTYEMPKILM
jgi:hypothetical protein